MNRRQSDHEQTSESNEFVALRCSCNHPSMFQADASLRLPRHPASSHRHDFTKVFQTSSRGLLSADREDRMMVTRRRDAFC